MMSGKFQLPEKINTLARRVHLEGGRALLVGGCVRDELMDFTPKDFDLEVYDIEPAKLRSLLEEFGRVDAVGESFTVYKLGNDLDVSLPRRERKTARGHRGFIVEGDPTMSFEDAARRRDFTINAIMRDPLTDEIVDPFDGRADIERKVLRAVSVETFGEDSLRVLRAAQFAARFEFTIDNATVELCRTIDLTDLPPERIWGEMEKLLLRARRPSIGLTWLDKLGAMRQLFPELEALKGVPQEYAWHPEGNCDIHTWLVCDVAHELIEDLPYAKQVTLMLAALCHDLGKPATTEFVDGRIRSLAHDSAGIAPTLSLLDRLKMYTLEGYDVRAQVVALVREHLRPGEFYKKRDEISDGAFRKLAARCELDLLYRLSRADNLSRNGAWLPKEKWFTDEAQQWFIKRARELAVEIRPPEAILMGRHLLAEKIIDEPSPQIGRVLKEVYEQQLEGRVSNLDEALELARSIVATEL
ncbi:MAG: hypothetical protein NVSMB56_15630 [Pyrinomonadaceae bacterium]